MESKYPVSFYFKVTFPFEGNGEEVAFQDVSGLSRELSIEEVGIGGENRFKYRLPTVGTSQNLVLKRAMVLKSSKLASWCHDTLDGGLIKPIKPMDVTVILLNPKGQTSKQWIAKKAYPVKYSISDLKSDENSLVFETIELTYTYFDLSKSGDT